MTRRVLLLLHLLAVKLVSEKIDRAVENPRHSLGSVIDKSIELNYLRRQKESIEKVDQLIGEAEQSLKELKKEFYRSTLQEINEGGQKVIEHSSATSKLQSSNDGKPFQRKSVIMTRSLYKMLSSVREPYSEGNISIESSQNKNPESGKDPLKSSLSKKVSEDKSLKSDSVKKMAESRSLEREKKTSRSTLNGDATGSNLVSPKQSSLDENEENMDTEYSKDDLEVEVLSVSFLPERAVVTEGSDTERPPPHIPKRTVRVANSVQCQNYSIVSAALDQNNSIAPIPVDVARFLHVKNSLYLKSDRDNCSDDEDPDLPVPVDVNRFMGVKNSLYLKMPSQSKDTLSSDNDEIDTSKRCSVRISAAPAREIPSHINPEPQENAEESPATEVNKNKEFLDKSDSTLLAKPSPSMEKPCQISNEPKTLVTPQDSYKDCRPVNVTTFPDKLSNESNTDCQCKAELEILRKYKSSLCSKKLSSQLKPPDSSKISQPSAAKKMSFCTESQTVSLEKERPHEKRSRGIFNDILTEEPAVSTDVDTDDSYLNTISERTEPDSVVPSQEHVSNKSKQLTIQHLPQINIRPPLVVQKVFEIEIKSTGSVNMQIPSIHNIRYEEVLHSEVETNEEIRPILMDDIVGKEQPYKFIDTKESVNVMAPNISLEDISPNGSARDDPSMNLIMCQSTLDDNSHKIVLDTEEIKWDSDSVDNMQDVNLTTQTNEIKLDESIDDASNLRNVDVKDDLASISSANEEKPELGSESDKQMDDPKLKANFVDFKFNSGSGNKNGTSTKDVVDLKNINVGTESIRSLKTINVNLKPSLKCIKSDIKNARSTSASIIFKLASGVILHPENETNGNVNASENPCGCREGSDHHADELGLIVDKSLDKVCECIVEEESNILIELKQSLHEIGQIEDELNQSLSEKALQEQEVENKKLNFAILDEHEEAKENSVEELEEQEVQEFNADDDIEFENREELFTQFLESQTPSLMETPPYIPLDKELLKLKDEIPNTSDGRITPKSENVKVIESLKSQKSEKGTPLFTADPDHPVASKLPKSISEFFQDTTSAISNEDEIEFLDNDQSEQRPLDELLKTNKEEETPQDPDELVRNVLTELDKDLNELGDQQIIAVNCDCVCKRDTEKPKELLLVPGEDNPPRTSRGNSKSSLKQKLLQKTRRKRNKSDTSNSIKKAAPDSSKTASDKSSPKYSPRNSSKRSSAGIRSLGAYDSICDDPDQLRPQPIMMKKQFSNKDFVDPHVKASLMGAFDLNKQASSLYTSSIAQQRISEISSLIQPKGETGNPSKIQSEESVYVLTHDVSTQVSVESVTPERRPSGGSKTDRKTPRVTISINSDEMKSRGPINTYSKKNKKVTSKDQIQQISEGNNEPSGETSEPSGEVSEPSGAASEQKEDSSKQNGDEMTQTVVLQPVMVYYESKGVQKSLEDWAYPPVKLHKMITCNDIESTSTNETDYENLPCRNAPCGDIPTSSEFIPLNTTRMLNRNYNTDDTTPPSEVPNLKIYRSPKYNYISSSTDTDSRVEESMSEGEIKCRCSTSVGELHMCCHKNGSKARTAYLKKHPEMLVRHEFYPENVQLLRYRKLYENWVTYYTSKTPSTNGSDTTEVSTDT